MIIRIESELKDKVSRFARAEGMTADEIDGIRMDSSGYPQDSKGGAIRHEDQRATR
jgi:hypothetical protein